jgi:hypothetical protein
MNSVSMATNCAPFCRAQKAATASLSVIRLIAHGYTIESAAAEAPRPLPQPEPRAKGFGALQGLLDGPPSSCGIPHSIPQSAESLAIGIHELTLTINGASPPIMVMAGPGKSGTQ